MRQSPDKRLLALGLALAFLVPIIAPAGAGGSQEEKGGGLRAVTSHNATLVLSDFITMQKHNVGPAVKGGMGLAFGAGLILDEIAAVSPSQNVYSPALAVNSKNDYILTWADGRNGLPDIYAQRFDKRMNKLGGEIAVCIKPKSQAHPAIAVDPQDNFMIAWEDENGGANGWNIYAQKFDSGGNKLGGEIAVCEALADQEEPAIASNSKGEFVVVWQDTRNFTNSHYDLYAQRLGANGYKLGPEIAVCDEPGDQKNPVVAMRPDDRFIIAWQDERDMTFTIYFMIFGSDGTKPPGEYVPCIGEKVQINPAIAVGPAGNFLVAWEDYRVTSPGIYARAYDSHDNPTGINFSISPIASSQPSVAVNPWGYYVVVYSDSNSGQADIYGRWLDQNGTLIAGAVELCGAANSQTNPAIAFDSRGDATAAWEDIRNGNTWHIFARQSIVPYLPSGNLTTGDLSPADVWAWGIVSANASFESPSDNSLSFEMSTDSGANWKPVPGNGSLAGAGSSSALRLRATFATTDNLTTPVLHDITIGYKVNRLPKVTMPADQTIPSKMLHDISPWFSDLDGDPLTYRWEQTGGPAASLNGTTLPVLQMLANHSGLYTFRIIANDGYNDSEPGIINLTVTNQAPSAVLSSNNSNPLVGTPVIFNGSASFDPDGTVTAYNFHFGDGSESGWVTAPTVVHVYALPGTYLVSLTVKDDDGMESAGQSATITVSAIPLLPDLAISAQDITISPEHPREGEIIKITARIHNVGQADAPSFGVQLIKDGTLAMKVDVSGLSQGSNTGPLFGIKYKALAGSHTFKVVIDPLGNITETSKANNWASLEISVAKKQATQAPAGIPWMLIGIVMVIILAAAAAAVMLMRRRKPVTVIQYQPPPPQPAYAPAPQPQAPQAMPSFQPQAPPPMPPQQPPLAPPPMPPQLPPLAPPPIPPPG
jgi:PKD repeat protein